MNIGWPEGIFLALTFMALGLSMSRHGQTRAVTENFAGSFVANMIVIGLLYWGGFFA